VSITDAQAESAVDYLRDTSEQYGKACGRLAYLEGNLRRVKALEMLQTKGSLGDREAQAYASEAYKDALEQLENATADRETIRAMRDAAQCRFEQWRTQTSARKAGV
jgi:hypothetical protein